jgi:hypothetical protein
LCTIVDQIGAPADAMRSAHSFSPAETRTL